MKRALYQADLHQAIREGIADMEAGWIRNLEESREYTLSRIVGTPGK